MRFFWLVIFDLGLPVGLSENFSGLHYCLISFSTNPFSLLFFFFIGVTPQWNFCSPKTLNLLPRKPNLWQLVLRVVWEKAVNGVEGLDYLSARGEWRLYPGGMCREDSTCHKMAVQFLKLSSIVSWRDDGGGECTIARDNGIRWLLPSCLDALQSDN